MATDYEAVLLNLHRDLFPERYLDSDAMERECLSEQWTSDTIEWVAGRIEDALAGHPRAQLDANHRPLTLEQKVEAMLMAMPVGGTVEIGELQIERKRAQAAFAVWDDGERWDENLAGAVQLVLEQDDDAVKEAIA